MTNKQEKSSLNPNLAQLSFIKEQVPPPDFTGAHVVLLNTRGQIILTKEVQANDDYFNLPGGGRELQETAQETVVRECQEELGVKIEPKRLVFLGNLQLGQVVFPLFFLSSTVEDCFDQVGFETQIYEWEVFLGMVAQLNPNLALTIGNSVNAQT